MILSKAFDYMDHGYNVIPILPLTKLPPIRWKEYQTRLATRDEWRVWADEFTSCNLAVVCGEVGRVVVVDADNAEAEQFCRLHMTTTPFRVRTRKGVHFYYRHPGRPIKSRARAHDALLIDIRGDGGLATGLGSIHETGHCYALDGDTDIRSVLDLPIYQPEWFPEPVAKPQTPPPSLGGDNFERATKYAMRVDGAGSGGRNFQAFRLSACLVKDFALTYDQAWKIMEDWNRRCDPPLDQQELLGVIKSAVATGSHSLGAKL